MDGNRTSATQFVADALLQRLAFDDPIKSRQERSRRSKEQMVSAALSAFMERGFEGVSTHDIAERAEVTQGLITYHFKSKEGLWQAAMDRLFGDFRNQLADRIRELNDIGDPLFFKLVIRHIVRWPTQYPYIVRFMAGTGSSESSHLVWLVERHIRPIYEVVGEILDAGKAQGILRDLPNLNVYFLLMTASSVFSLKDEIRLLTGVDVFQPEFVEEQADTLVRMLVKSSN